MKVDTNEITAALLMDMKADVDDVIAGYDKKCQGIDIPMTPIVKYLEITYGCIPFKLNDSSYSFRVKDEIFTLSENRYGIMFELIEG